MPTPAEIFSQTKRMVAGLSLRQKLASGVVAAAALASFAALFFFVNSVTYRTLYADLAPEDAAAVVSWLKAAGHPYRIAQEGGAIQVPEDRVYDIRLELAGAGLPKGSGIGFEVFDKTSIGATDFVQNVQYQRALQGELERTISRFPQVKAVRVHIAQPRESLFLSDSKDPTASVVLDLKPGQELTQGQVNGIVHLVSSSVPRLSREGVSVVDTTGELLSGDRFVGGDLQGLTASQLAYRKQFEEHVRQKIQSMLDNVLGAAKSVVRVSADLDFDQVQVSEDRFDPDESVVRSEQKHFETDMAGGTGGIPGVTGGLADKLQGNAGQAAGTGNTRQQRQETTNYEISRIQRQVSGAQGTVKRLSVGVLVDGIYKPENGQSVYAARSPEEIANFERIVKAAMGFSRERGDEVSVVNVPFTVRSDEPQGTFSQVAEVGGRFVKPFVNLVLAILFIVFVLRPLMERFVRGRGGKAADRAISQAGAEAIEAGGAAVLEHLPDARKELRDIASDYPERAAALVKIWLREGLESSKEPKDGRSVTA